MWQNWFHDKVGSASWNSADDDLVLHQQDGDTETKRRAVEQAEEEDFGNSMRGQVSSSTWWARWPGGQVVRWPGGQVAGGTEKIGEWGIPEKSIQNVA